MFPVLYANTPLAVGLDTMGGYDSSVDVRTVTLARVLLGEDPAAIGDGRLPGAFNAVYFSSGTRFDLARRLGVTAVVTAPPRPGLVETWGPTWEALGARRTYRDIDGDVFAVPDPLNGPRLVPGDEVVDGDEAALARFADPAFPYETAVVVEAGELRRTGLAALGPAAVDEPPAAGSVDAASRGVNTVSVDVTSPGPAWLLVPDHWAEGWSATVNGRDVPVVRVNYNQRAVRVEAGTSAVRMRYRSPGFNAGAAVSTLTVLGALVAFAALTVAGRRRRETERGPGDGLELEQQLVAEHARVDGDPDPVDALHEPPAQTGGGSDGRAVGEHVER
jgi:hypothetical protein